MGTSLRCVAENIIDEEAIIQISFKTHYLIDISGNIASKYINKHDKNFVIFVEFKLTHIPK